MDASIEDRIAIEEVLVRYTVAIDDRNFDLLDQVFTEDATIDFRSTGGIAGPLDVVKKWLPDGLSRFRILQHYVSNFRIATEGKRATSRCYLLAVHGYKGDDGMRFFEIGGEYEDALRKTELGWRIERRLLTARFFRGEPPPRSP